jgi:hypothetical protein
VHPAQHITFKPSLAQQNRTFEHLFRGEYSLMVQVWREENPLVHALPIKGAETYWSALTNVSPYSSSLSQWALWKEY